MSVRISLSAILGSLLLTSNVCAGPHDQIQAAANAVGAYEANREKCGYGPALEKAIGEMEYHFANENAYVWDHYKARAPQALAVMSLFPGAGGNGGACRVAAQLIGMGMVLSIGIVTNSPELEADLAQMNSAGSGANQNAAAEPSTNLSQAEKISAELKKLLDDPKHEGQRFYSLVQAWVIGSGARPSHDENDLKCESTNWRQQCLAFRGLRFCTGTFCTFYFEIPDAADPDGSVRLSMDVTNENPSRMQLASFEIAPD
jgi:hypothetical protein